MSDQAMLALFGIPALLTFPVAGALLLDAAFDLRLLAATKTSKAQRAEDPRWSYARDTVRRQGLLLLLNVVICLVAGANAFPLSDAVKQGLTVWGLIAVPWIVLALVVLDARGRRQRHRMRIRPR